MGLDGMNRAAGTLIPRPVSAGSKNEYQPAGSASEVGDLLGTGHAVGFSGNLLLPARLRL